VGQLTIAFAMQGMGYAVAYSFALWLYFGFGCMAGATPRKLGWTFGDCVALGLAIAGLTGLSLLPSRSTSSIAESALIVVFPTLTFGLLVGLAVWCFEPGAGGGSSTSASSHTITTSAYGSSSYGSSSSSTRSSYGGGGGSSGGGGASSSW